MKVNALLGAALDLLDDPDEDAPGAWPHAAAVLTRQAIESTVTIWWKDVEPAMVHANGSERWLALPSYLGRSPLIADAHYAWVALSNACHHRSYDIGLTEPELRGHLHTANVFAKHVGQRLQERAAKAGATTSA